MKAEELFSTWTVGQLEEDLRRGGKFVVFTYSISIIFMTFRKASSVYYIRSDESAFATGFKYMLISLVLGWWGIPWGPIYTIQSIWYAFTGKDVTEEILNNIREQQQENYSMAAHPPKSLNDC